MDMIKLPQSLAQYKKRMVSANGTEIIWHRAVQETEKARVTLSTHLIVLVVRGAKEVYSPAGKLSIGSGEGFFLKAGNYLMTEKLLHEQRFESLTIFFPSTVASALSQLLPLASVSAVATPDIFRIEQSAALDTFAHSLLHYAEMDSNEMESAFLVDAKLRELFWILLRTPGVDGFTHVLRGLQSSTAVRLEELMEQHYREHLTLDRYAFLAGCSLSTFKRLFEDVFRMPPRRWIQERRLREAHRLLHTAPDKNITDICFESGFENVSHFVQVFKARYGKTPHQFRLELPATSSGLPTI